MERELIAQAWTGLTDGMAIEAPGVEISGARGGLPSVLPVQDVAVACVATALLAGAALDEARGGRSRQVRVDREHVAFAVRSERYFTSGGTSTGAGFAPLSRFWAASDGCVRTHANYPWHRAALLDALGTNDDADSVAAAMAERSAVAIEDEVFAAGGIAAAVRTLAEWGAHPQGQAVAAEPLIAHQVVGEAPARHRGAAGFPATGIRVLDLTRVIAGPVCTRYLAAVGADVLRLDPPGRPDGRRGEPSDPLLGKRSAMLDAAADGETLHQLLDEADVLVSGYRLGALDRFGLAPDALADRHPGLVVVLLDAWGHTGPWAGRRGFDSIVQGPSGIADIERVAGAPTPGALPCQLLDHGTGYLAAAAALDGLRRQTVAGGTHVRRVSLARTAWWLTHAADGAPDGAGRAAPVTPASPAGDPGPWTVTVAGPGGSVTAISPPGSLGDRRLQWPAPVAGYGADAPAWPAGGRLQ